MQLALGTAQFGIPYGIAGRSEAVPEVEVRAILEDAAAEGVTTLDTASAYGVIESRLAALTAGLPFRIVSKIPALDDALDPDAAARAAMDAARQSRARLGIALHALMVHRAQDLMGARGEAIWKRLAPWARDEGIALGASCYSVNDAATLADRPGVALCQIPGNALDQHVARPEIVVALSKVDVHLRSVFLQGLLLMRPAHAAERLPAAAEAVTRWNAWAASRDLSALEAAVSVVKSFKAVSTVVVGVDNLTQWRAIAAAWRSAQPYAAPELAIDCSDIIDPRTWSVKA